MNPIKTTREMLLELAGLPKMAGGKKVEAGLEMGKLVQQAIQKYVAKYKKQPPPEDVEALKAHAAALSQKKTVWTDPTTQARARHELATNYGLMNPEDVRDPFLTQSMLGRAPRSTNLPLHTYNVDEPNFQRMIEGKQLLGQVDELTGAAGQPSSTAASDAIARMAGALEQSALSSGKVPLIEKLKIQFAAKNKRQPTEEELDALIASYNPMRHQYGSLGPSIVQSRPPTAKGMKDWKEKARREGVPEVYLEKSPADYPQYLRQELEIGQGRQPGVTPMSDDLIPNPNREYSDGRAVAALTPAEMEAMLLNQGYTPGKFRDRAARMLQGAGRVGSAVAKSAPGRVAGKTARVAIPVLGAAGSAYQGYDLGRRLAKDDYLGAMNSAISAGLNLAGLPGMAAAVPFDIMNEIRDAQRRKYSPMAVQEEFEPTEDYRSVMEGYR